MSKNKEKPVVEVINAIKIYDTILEDSKVSALQGCDLEIQSGEIVSIIGPSGAGKSTLLRILSGIEAVSSGECYIGGFALHRASDRQRREFRRKYIGFFTQAGRQNLDPNMTVYSALRWEAINSGWKNNAASERADKLLDRLGLEQLRDRKCGALSAGEAMRVSLVKAIMKKPFVVLADEPTGQLDTVAVRKLIELMKEVVSEGISIIVATHDIRFQNHSDKNYLILQGRLATQEEGKDLLRRRGSFSAFEEGLFSSTTLIDSNNFIRIPDQILEQLGISKKISISHDPNKNYAIIKKNPDDPTIIRKTKVQEVLPFNRKKIKEEVIFDISSVSKTFTDKSGSNEVLRSINLKIRTGEFVVLLGPSGSGKTTLINLIGGFDRPTQGTIKYQNKILSDLSSRKRNFIQLHEFSYLTQNYTVHPYLSVAENAQLPLILQNKDVSEREEDLRDLLNELEISMYQGRYPTSLSGGQQQRVSLSASLLKNTKVLLADEPTANLDADLAITVMNQLTKVAESGITTIVATHDFLGIRPGYRVVRVDNSGIIDDQIADQTYCEELQNQYLNQE